MYFFHQYEVFATILLAVLPTTCVADVVNSGFDVYEAAQVMMSKASHSWEWGTAAEALLELYNNEISVFSSNPFPNGKIPSVSANTLALSYAKQFISTELQVLVPDLAVGDPASLGVSAILLGTSDSKYTAAAQRQADYILNQAPKWSNGAISHRGDVAEIWADNMAMSFPFCRSRKRVTPMLFLCARTCSFLTHLNFSSGIYVCSTEQRYYDGRDCKAVWFAT